MSNSPIVYGVVRVTIEVPVQPSSPDETFAYMRDTAIRVAERRVEQALGTTGKIIASEILQVVIK